MRQDFEPASDQRPVIYRYLDLEIDPMVPAITRAGQPIELRAYSTGKVSVKCLNPVHTVALTPPAAGFDSRVFHRLEVVVRGEELEALLDGRPLIFHQGDHTTRIVQVQPHWERPAQIGKNHGAVGIAFSSEPLRLKAGGQQARGFTVLPYQTNGAHR